jgi:hypothetical protein
MTQMAADKKEGFDYSLPSAAICVICGHLRHLRLILSWE